MGKLMFPLGKQVTVLLPADVHEALVRRSWGEHKRVAALAREILERGLM